MLLRLTILFAIVSIISFSCAYIIEWACRGFLAGLESLFRGGLIFAVLCCSFSINGTAVETNSPSAFLKAFLQTRPPIKNILFLNRTAEAKDGTNWALPDRWQVFSGGWSQEGFFLRQLTNPASVNVKNTRGTPAGGLCAGQVGSKYWQIVVTNMTYTEFTGNKNFPTNPIVVFAFAAEEILHKALNMGVPGLADSTLKWEDDKFIADLSTKTRKIKSVQIKETKTGKIRNLNTTQVFGQLFSEGDRPLEMHTRDFDPDLLPERIVKYRYSDTHDLPGRLPDIIVEGREGPKGFIPANEIRILSLELSDNDSSSHFLDPTNFIESKYQASLLYSNGSLYAFQNGRLKKVPNRVDVTRSAIYKRFRSGRDYPKRFVVYFLFFLCATIPVFFLFRSSKQKPQ